MSDSQSQSGIFPMFRLRTLGTLALAGPDSDTVLGQHGHHHRRLALLAVLAAAGDSGKSRDQLLLLFWPEATQTRARHSLDQLLYAIRGSLHEEIFDGANPVRLNRAVITSDIAEFADSLRRHDFEEAVSMVGGQFLEGFHLSDAPEFEQWMESERSRVARAYVEALEKLARQYEEQGDPQSAVRWRRKISEVDPLSSRAATALMSALAAAGDETAALQHAELYAALVRRELNVPPSLEVAALAEKIRSGSHDRVTRLPHSPAAQPIMQAQPHPHESQPVAVPPQTVRRKSSRAVVFGIAAVAVLAAVIGAASLMRDNRANPRPAESSIAVLPLQNLSTDANDASIGDGLTEELISVLSRLPELRVISRTSSFAFKGSRLGGRAIGDSLHVSNLLEGSVQKNGRQIRVQVRLIDTRDGSTKWSESYERSMQDVFAMQSEIASAVVRELDLRVRDTALARIKRGSTSSIAAYELYLRANDPARTRSDSAVREGIKLFEQAIAADPNYAAAYAGLARLHLRLAGNDPGMSLVRHIEMARWAVGKALSLDDKLADAHASNALLLRRSLNMEHALVEMERAVALDPGNGRIREWLTQLYILANRPDEALAEASLAVRIDPLSPTANAELAHALIADNRCDEALARLAPLRALKPPLLRATTYSTQCFLRKGMIAEAVSEVNRTAGNTRATGDPFRAYVYARAGKRDDARKLLREILSRDAYRETANTDIALIYAGLGDKDEAFKWLNKPLFGDPWVTLEVLLEALKDDPRLDSFRNRIGLQKR